MLANPVDGNSCQYACIHRYKSHPVIHSIFIACVATVIAVMFVDWSYQGKIILGSSAIFGSMLYVWKITRSHNQPAVQQQGLLVVVGRQEVPPPISIPNDPNLIFPQPVEGQISSPQSERPAGVVSPAPASISISVEGQTSSGSEERPAGAVSVKPSQDSPYQRWKVVRTRTPTSSNQAKFYTDLLYRPVPKEREKYATL